MQAVTYPSQDPVAKTLRSFQVDITANPALHELLEQLRGAKVTSSSGGGAGAAAPSWAWRRSSDPAGRQGQGAGGRRLVPQPADRRRGRASARCRWTTCGDLTLEDPRLRDELARALAALAAARDQDKKPVTIRFSGQGDRRVRIGYVVETPVWKTSYRLILSDRARRTRTGAIEQGERQGRHGRHEGRRRQCRRARRGRKRTVRAGATAAAGGSLQGWAIVENQTDNDWNDVQLSLVSGRPISFIQDLYQPLYVPRPVVQPELYASLRPQTYDAGMDDRDKNLDSFKSRNASREARSEGKPDP